MTAVAPRFLRGNSAPATGAAGPARSWVAERALVVNPEGQWQPQAQVLHWAWWTWRGGQLAQEVFGTPRPGRRGLVNPDQRDGLALGDDSLKPDRMAAVIGGPVILRSTVANPGKQRHRAGDVVDGAPAGQPGRGSMITAVLDAMGAPPLRGVHRVVPVGAEESPGRR